MEPKIPAKWKTLDAFGVIVWTRLSFKPQIGGAKFEMHTAVPRRTRVCTCQRLLGALAMRVSDSTSNDHGSDVGPGSCTEATPAALAAASGFSLAAVLS